VRYWQRRTVGTLVVIAILAIVLIITILDTNEAVEGATELGGRYG
jgi:hypothetical protein